MDQEPAEDILPLPDNFSYRILSWPPVFLWTQIRFSWEMLWHAPDILFIPAHTMPIFHPKKTFVTLHDVGFERFTHLYSPKPIGPKKGILKLAMSWGTKLFTFGKYQSTELDYHRWSTRFALKHAKSIFTISRFSKSEILYFFGKEYENKIKVIYSAFDAVLFKSDFSDQQIQAIRQKYNITGPYLYFIGRLEEKKNTIGLIEAFNILRTRFQQNILLVLLGKEGYGYDKVSTKITEYGLEKFIIRPEQPTEDERAMLMKTASVFVFPSFYEGFGIPPLEAMACSVPVVAANTAAIPEVCQNAAILVDPQNTYQLAREIYYVLNDEGLRRSLVQKGRAQIEKFSWKKCACQTIDALLEKKQDLEK